MHVSPGLRVAEAFARVAVLDVLLMLGLYIVRGRGWRTTLDIIIGSLLTFYLNGRIVRSAFSKAYPNHELPRFFG